MDRRIVIAIIGITLLISVALGYDIYQTETDDYSISSNNITYYIYVNPIEVESGDQVKLTIRALNTAGERINISIVTSSSNPLISERDSITIPSNSSKTIRHSTQVYSEKHGVYNISVSFFEEPGEDFLVELPVEARPTNPSRTPSYVLLGTMTIVIVYLIFVITFDLLGESIWIHEEPLRYMVGVIIGSFTMIISNDWIWNRFGFLNDSIYISILIIFMSLTLSTYYLEVFSELVSVQQMKSRLQKSIIKSDDN